MHRILIVDDEPNIRKLLSYDLKSQGYEVEEAENGLDALKKAEIKPFDVYVLDWMMPQLSGLDLVKKLREHHDPGIMMMITAKDTECDLLEAFEAGVDDYLVKPFSPRELSARLKAHLKRYESLHNQRQEHFGNLSWIPEQFSFYIQNKKLDLTYTEYRLLEFLLTHINQVLSRDQILNHLWGFEYDGDTRVVDVHIFKLRRELKDADLKIESVRGVGYIAKI